MTLTDRETEFIVAALTFGFAIGVGFGLAFAVALTVLM